MQPLELRDEFLSKHMRATAIELRNKQKHRPGRSVAPKTSSGSPIRHRMCSAHWRRSLWLHRASPSCSSVSAGRGKSHIMALLHHAFSSPRAVAEWGTQWGAKLNSAKLKALKLQSGFQPISETLSNQEYAYLWDLIFDRHPKGEYYKGQFKHAGTTVPAKSILQDMFAPAAHRPRPRRVPDLVRRPARRRGARQRPEAQAVGLQLHPDSVGAVHGTPRPVHGWSCPCGTTAPRRSSRFTVTAAVVIDFKGETAKEDRKRLLLHRLFKNRDNFGESAVETVVARYAVRTQSPAVRRQDRRRPRPTSARGSWSRGRSPRSCWRCLRTTS